MNSKKDAIKKERGYAEFLCTQESGKVSGWTRIPSSLPPCKVISLRGP
jgi:hypothetical protein